MYEERLTAPPSWWAGGLAVSLLLAAGVHSGAGGARAVVPYVALPLLTVLALVVLGRGQVRVADGVLHVPGARVPLAVLGGARPLDREGVRQVRGPLADPRALVVSRPWLSGGVRVQLEDPEDDTPYWLVGSRRPAALAAAIASGGRGPSS